MYRYLIHYCSEKSYKGTFVNKTFPFNPIPAGGGQFAPPPVVFLHNSKSIGLGRLKFSYVPKALPLGLKPGFNTNCLSP